MLVFLFLVVSTSFASAAEEELVSFNRQDTSFYSTFFKKQVYDTTVGLLEPVRLARLVTFTKPPALDINRYDEIIDNEFFTNRHGKKRLTIQELKNAPLTKLDQGPSTKGPWTILKGKTDGVTPGFFIKDINGDKFLLKFDPRANPEMTTAAEIIAHKFFYAFGYNVPSYSLVMFKPDILEVDPEATFYNENGFKQPLTREKVMEMLKMYAPIFKGGKFRASASRIIEGDLIGYFDYDTNRQDIESDLIPHDQLRSLRGLRVFGSWTNNYDLHRKNTMDVLIEENGKKRIKHYLLDFGSSFGSAAYRPKVPVVGFEHMIDYEEIVAATGLLKVTEKPWERRWDNNNQLITSPSIGYFDNREFNPGTWKSNLPHYTFNYLTNADGYWAAKIVSSFTDEDISTVVKTGQLTNKSDEDYLINTLIERRDMVAKYWFDKVSPLENFYISANPEGIQVSFDDLSVQKGWAPDRTYQYKFYSLDNGKKKLIEKGSSENSVLIIPRAASSKALLEISAINNGKAKQPAKVIFETSTPYRVTDIEH